ncbi:MULTISPECIES: protein-L-isoaspartate O-methyltransferase [unclassified Sphingomonas]|uniref:protein-L-isoaspartate O-methyltransferase family protein n=1 Tax=unclassified Sphingomonas TaxID=196159 RepID=UPI002150EA1F|nr:MULTISPECIES: protein-L-isoaspartate O-methyltransferase [unclassified Sphingomonas]MCR5872447.1 protein-L-isoaspartate O-methyltransferase [Sphingomonas sp. J344]UUX99270.1 protein-L-isoaspartate O-methyltransferase [Sphingomonas sp. J315]
MMTATIEPQGQEAARAAMVASQLRTSGVNDARVVAAMAQVAREDYLPESQRAFAYRDRSLPLGNGRAQNPPLATGLLLTEARIVAGEKALIVGAAGGYAAAIAAELGAVVTLVEEDVNLVALARAALGNGVTLVEGSLAAGAPAGAPYDLLLIDGAVEEIPEALAAQLREGGRVVTGLSDRGVTRIASGVRTGGGVGLASIVDSEIAPLPGFEKPRGFQF